MADTTGTPNTPNNSNNQNNANNSNNSNNSDSFMETLRGAGEASLNAWSRLGDLAGEFSRNFRADRSASVDTGAHHANGEDLTDDHIGFADQLKAAVTNARKAYQSAKDDNAFRAATASFAGDAESIFRDFAGSVTRAADTARESTEANQTKQAFSAAVDEVRETFNTAISQVRKGASNSDGDVEGTVADLRTRLEDMISRVSGAFDGAANFTERTSTETTKGAATGSATEAAKESSGEPGIVDGEVVGDDVIEDDTDGTDHTKN